MSRDLSTNSFLDFDFSKSKIVIVQSTYHSDITNNLKEGALKILKEHGVTNILYIEMPGAYELVYGCNKAISILENINGIIALGCVIKGDTDHDIYINQAVASGLIQLENNYKIPIGFGLLTTNNLQQAVDRSGGNHGNKGEETAMAVLHAMSFKVNKL
jgi:6,7-dimethyl-8-ribityllumazine synthase